MCRVCYVLLVYTDEYAATKYFVQLRTLQSCLCVLDVCLSLQLPLWLLVLHCVRLCKNVHFLRSYPSKMDVYWLISLRWASSMRRIKFFPSFRIASIPAKIASSFSLLILFIVSMRRWSYVAWRVLVECVVSAEELVVPVVVFVGKSSELSSGLKVTHFRLGVEVLAALPPNFSILLPICILSDCYW